MRSYSKKITQWLDNAEKRGKEVGKVKLVGVYREWYIVGGSWTG